VEEELEGADYFVSECDAYLKLEEGPIRANNAVWAKDEECGGNSNEYTRKAWNEMFR
jgi:hypothetical protein